jgi:hypothetical protein
MFCIIVYIYIKHLFLVKLNILHEKVPPVIINVMHVTKYMLPSIYELWLIILIKTVNFKSVQPYDVF